MAPTETLSSSLADVAVRQAPPMDRRFARLLAVDDFERAARRHLPRMLYGFIAGGTETDAAVRANLASFQDYSLVPRMLKDVSKRGHAATLFGKSYSAPFGIAPMGAA